MNQLATVESDLPAVQAQPDAMSLVGRAIEAGQPMENITQLIELVKFNDQREALRQFNQAFTAAQAEFPAIRKTKKAHNSWYAPYSAIVATIQPVLIKHGLSFRHSVAEADGMQEISCILSHSAGHSEIATIRVPADGSGSKNGIQAIGSSITYGKRYTLEAVTGVVTTDDDTDGNLPLSQEVKLISEEQALKLHAAIEENELNMDAWLDKVEKITGERSFGSITADGFQKVWDTVQQAVKKKREASK